MNLCSIRFPSQHCVVKCHTAHPRDEPSHSVGAGDDFEDACGKSRTGSGLRGQRPDNQYAEDYLDVDMPMSTFGLYDNCEIELMCSQVSVRQCVQYPDPTYYRDSGRCRAPSRDHDAALTRIVA